jgi:DNA-binding MarR family transcriptional regulator
LTGSSDLRRIGITCRSAADGRRAIRALGEWSERFELSEPEFQILWCLKSASGGCDQTTIARQLACSPAQISTTVERMRAAGWIAQQSAPGDRRRRLWQLSAQGQALLAEMLRAANELRYPVTINAECASVPDRGSEAA